MSDVLTRARPALAVRVALPPPLIVNDWLSPLSFTVNGSFPSARVAFDSVQPTLSADPSNEPPGARARVGLSGLTVAEYFRDQGQDVLFFVDNIFRFTQAGSEVSALLGRIPSAVGYQPTLATDMGALQERITTTNKGSITSVQAI